MVGQAVLGHRGVSLDHPGALRSIVGVGLYLGVLGVFAVGLGTAIRRSAGAIAVLFGLIFLVPALVPLLPSSVQGSVTTWSVTVLVLAASKAGPGSDLAPNSPGAIEHERLSVIEA